MTRKPYLDRAMKPEPTTATASSTQTPQAGAAPAAPPAAKARPKVLEVKPGRHAYWPDFTYRGPAGYRALEDDPFIDRCRHSFREAKDQKAPAHPVGEWPTFWRNEAGRRGYSNAR